MTAAVDDVRWWACAWCREQPVRERGSVCVECRAEAEHEAHHDERVALLDVGAYDDPDECVWCGAELRIVGGALVGAHWRLCPASRGHLRVVS